jgi:hypothetical protein
MHASAFGFIGDGVIAPGATFATQAIGTGTDNAAAWMAFNAFARQQDALGRGTDLIFDPGVYFYNYVNCYGCLFGIRRLRISAHGSDFQNIYDSTKMGANFGASSPWPFASQPLLFGNKFSTPASWFINQTTPRSLTFQLINPSDVSNFAVGDPICLASEDLQYNGWPINPNQFEYHRINAINPTTGVITVDEPIRYQHRIDFPDFNMGSVPCGKARVWHMSPTPTIPWDIDHHYEGMTVYVPPGGGHVYTTFSGEKITTVDWTGVAPSETITGSVVHKRPRWLTQGETDKMNASIRIENVDTIGGLLSQSASTEYYEVVGGRINGAFGGAAKRIYGRGLEIMGGSGIAIGSTYGTQYDFTLDSCRVSSTIAPSVFDGIVPKLVDGVNVTYSKGVFTLNKVGLGYDISHWALPPGTHINLSAKYNTGSVFSGDAGFGTVTGSTEDATNIYIATTLAFQSLPPWFSGSLYTFKNMEANFRGCTGSDNIRVANEACAAGARYFDRKRWTFGGGGLASHLFQGLAGTLVSVDCNVLVPNSVAGAVANMSFTTFDPVNNFTQDVGGVFVSVNIGVAGVRRFSTAGNSKLGTDSVTVGGVATSILPNRVLGGLLQINTSAPGSPPHMFDVILTTDCGMTRRPSTTQFDGGGINQVLNTKGMIV